MHRAVGFDSEQEGGQNETEDRQMLAQVWSDNTALAKQATVHQGGNRPFAASARALWRSRESCRSMISRTQECCDRSNGGSEPILQECRIAANVGNRNLIEMVRLRRQSGEHGLSPKFKDMQRSLERRSSVLALFPFP